MKIGKIVKAICFLAIVIPLSSVPLNNKNSTTLSSHNGHIGPKYLLAGALDSIDGDYIYYSINNDTEYAVGLTDAAKSDDGTKNVPSEYNNKAVTGIWRSGFYNSQATTINIPSSITVIDYEAFLGSKITSLTIPASVNQIGEGAFYSCKSLTKVAMQNSSATSDVSSACSCSEITNVGEGERTYSTLTTIPSFCFFNCVALKELVLPQSIEEIEYEAFYNCFSLYSTLAFMNINAIRSRAFQGCRALKKVYISSSFFEKDENQEPVGIIEEKAFDGCNTNLEFYLVGNEDDITTWRGLARNAKWNCKSEYSNPGSSDVGNNRYVYHTTPAGSGVAYTNDWIFTTENGEVEITSYIGPTEKDELPITFLSLPDELPSGTGNKVRTIAKDALQTVKASLKRIYLPVTLKRIEASMFDSSYNLLSVIDDNTHCSLDENEANPTPRIILNGITDLEVIGKNAFDGMPKKADVKKLYLPYSLKAIGSSAFNNFKGVNDFKWDYDDEDSVLEVVGRQAFYRLGGNYKEPFKNNGTINYSFTTLIFPRTFRHFGITGSDNTTFNLGGSEGNDTNFGASAFEGCPLLEKVVFRGSKKSFIQSTPNNTDNGTKDLVIPTLTFAYNRSLRTIVFEERCGRKILFHTLGGAAQPSIGWSSGKGSNDFLGDPALQTLVLPNVYTSLYIQNFAFTGNSHGAIYFSGTENNKMSGNTNTSCTNAIGNMTNNSTAIANITKWRTIGDEGQVNGSYPGYWFDSDENKFGIDQKMPIYNQVYYKDTINLDGNNSVDVEVGIGNSKEYVIKDRCAFVTGTGNGSGATMTKYLYDRYSNTFNGTATVPSTVNNSNSVSFTVNAIGASAFSAEYSDGSAYANYTSYKDLTAVSVPNTIVSIGEYAFMRAYGVTKVSSYDPSTGNSDGDYVMPSSLTLIDKHAFAFCNIKQVLNIPLSCVLYENTDDSDYVTSVFTNNFALRKITFGNNATSSPNYFTTTYVTHDSLNTYTSALYSTSAVSKNKSTLLLVLNRDSDDKACVSPDVSIIPVKNYSQFDGSANATKFLYGAFKMCYWIDALVVGSACNDSLNEPLISGIEDVVYLNTFYDYSSKTCSLKAITLGNSGTFSVPAYAFSGCEQLIEISLPQIPGGTLPAGLFAYIGSSTRFIVPGDANNTTTKTCDLGELDLRFTGYSCIAADAFKNTGITTVIAPETTDFTIESDAFADCQNLTSFDFQYVTGTVTLNGAFRRSSIPTGLFNFGSSAKIYFGEEAFKECTFGNGTFTFPAKTAEIGKACFESCTNLKTVSAAADLAYLDSFESDESGNLNNKDHTGGFKQIGDYAFHLCTSLDNFDFTKFTQIERIGHHAFSMLNTYEGNSLKTDAKQVTNTAKICTDGILDLPANITNLGVGAFYGSKITDVTINSTSILFERGGKYTNDTRASTNTAAVQFRYCTELKRVFFKESTCVWRGLYLTKGAGDQSNYFSNCTKLEIVTLPSTFDLYHFGNGSTDNTRPDSMVWDSKNTCKFYVYHSLKDKQQGQVINEFWHRIKSGTVCDIVYCVNNNLDVAKYVTDHYELLDSTAQFWTIHNNTITYLGTATVNSSTGLVTFSASGYTADSSGVHYNQ